MKKKRIAVYLAMAVALISSCSIGEVTKELNRIESFIQERPDSALTAIRAIDTNALRSKSLKAQYSLLHSMALDKNYIDTINLSVIMPAIEFYEKTGDAVHKMRAWYYHGRILQNAGKSQDAMYSFLKALDESKETEDYFYKGLINSIIAGLYSTQYSSEEALKYAKDAYECFMNTTDTLGQWLHQGKLAVYYGNNREKDEADSVYQEFIKAPVLDSTYYAKTLFLYAKFLVGRRPFDPERSIYYFNLAKDTYHGKPTIENYYAKAYALTLIGQNEDADIILKKLETHSKGAPVSDYYKYKIFRHRGLLGKALLHYEQSIKTQDSVIIANLQQSLERTKKKYSEERLLKESEARNADNLRAMITVLVLSVVLLIILMILYYSKQKWTTRLEIISQLKEEAEKQYRFTAKALNENESKLMVYRQKYLAAYKSQYFMLNNLCASYLSPSSTEPKDKIYNEVKGILEEFTDDSKEVSKAEDIVNKEHNNIIEGIRKDFPRLSEKDYRLIALFIMGFEAKTIGLLTNYTTKTVYGKKDRIKKTISTSSVANKEIILKLIG